MENKQKEWHPATKPLEKDLQHTRIECYPIRLLLWIPELQLAGPGVVQGPSTLRAAPPPVNLHMRLQVVLVGKAHLAQITLEPFLAAVYQLSRHHCTIAYFFQFGNCAGISEQSIGTRSRNRVGIGLSHRPARLHSLAELVPWNRFLGSLKV
jgi:hypothetical protein